jgi:hypothetical protein
LIAAIVLSVSLLIHLKIIGVNALRNDKSASIFSRRKAMNNFREASRFAAAICSKTCRERRTFLPNVERGEIQTERFDFVNQIVNQIERTNRRVFNQRSANFAQRFREFLR